TAEISWPNRQFAILVAMDEQAYPQLSPDLMLSIARERLARQLSFLDSLDTKLGTLFAASSGLLGILAAILALRPSEAGTGGWLALGFAGIAFATVACHAVRHLDPRPFNIGVDVDRLWEDHFRQEDHLLRWKTATDYLCYFDENRPKYLAKVKAVRWAVWAVTAESAALVAGLALVAVAA
ncbi:MAG: hypothetical protein JSU97_00095, partial [Dehalococcoidia bacterium]